MRFATTGAAVISAASVVLAKEMAVDEDRAAKLYDSGLVHESIVKKKMVRSPANLNATSFVP
jgi:hypothetical protein